MLHITRLHRLTRLPSVCALLFCSALALAQRPAPRIRGPIELTPSVPLEGSLNPRVRLSDDLGPLAPETPIRGVTLVFKRSPAQEADLQQLLAQQAEPSSSLYHHWLTPEEFAARFGIADADIAAAESWLQSHGFTIDTLARSPSSHTDRITFSGTATQIQQAFGTELHHLRFPGDADTELHFAPISELSLPPALAPLTAAVLHLSDFRPRPSVRPIPNYTTAAGQSHFLAPRDVASMYDLGQLSTSANGSGQSLAIVGQSYVKNPGVVSAFANYFGNVPNITPVIVPGSGVEAIIPGDVGESEIDLEYSSALAPVANILFVYTGASPNYDVFDSLAFAITNDIAPVISISYGACEPLISTSILQQYNALFQQAAAQGQTIVASSGDTGSTTCAPYSSANGVSTTQQQALAVGFPASSPYVTAVGGTQMAPGTFAAGASNYWNAATDTDNNASLISYVPEVVWNEDSPTYGLAASGGGPSSIFPRPFWQSGVPGIPSGSFRLVPDIALQASLSSPGYIICTDDPNILGTLTDCATSGLKASNGAYILTGGTSFGAPIFAALLTDLNAYQQTQGLGNVNPTLYSLATQPAIYSSVFHDVTSGTTACAIGEGNCGTPGTTGYAATTGYDMATGLGSLDFGKLVSNWPSAASRTAVPMNMYVYNLPKTANPGATSSINVELDIDNALCGNNCKPPALSGNLLILVDGAALTPAPLQPSGLNATATWNFVAPSTTGSHVVVVRYPGDAYHAPRSATLPVLVGNVVPSGSFTLSANNLTLTSNGSGSTQITITPAGGYSGALSWSSTYTGGTVSQPLCYLVQSRAVNGPSTATLNMGAGTACGSAPTGSSVPSSVQRTALDRPSKPASYRASAAAFVALLLCGILPSRRRRRLLPFLSTALLTIVVSTLTGCGGGSKGSTAGGSNSNPQAQVYTITLKATDSVNPAITASTSFALTVN